MSLRAKRGSLRLWRRLPRLAKGAMLAMTGGSVTVNYKEYLFGSLKGFVILWINDLSLADY